MPSLAPPGRLRKPPAALKINGAQRHGRGRSGSISTSVQNDDFDFDPIIAISQIVYDFVYTFADKVDVAKSLKSRRRPG